ncbi:MAG TPA: hypothetical protein VNI53_07265 [Gammaproteobacteria bacterium]|nr:hypothetical protein [Gammaproteobacteria bacterium]
MKIIVIALFIVLMFSACTKTPDKTVSIEAGTPANNQAVIKTALKQLMASCIGLNEKSYDLINWHAILSSSGDNPYNYHTENWGWKEWVEVTVEVRTNARDLPKEWNARGQVLKYDLGGGTQPGINGKNTLSQLMCGTLPVSNDPNNPDTFLSVPEMKVLDQLK